MKFLSSSRLSNNLFNPTKSFISVDLLITYKIYVDDNQPSPDEIQASQHPKLLKYFKMEKVGVPAPAIKGKMKVEGIDPSLLDDPNKFIRKDAFGVENSIEVDGDDSSDDDD